jgi:glycine/D-amino acid oxidase-like deaminating enzyme
LASAQQAAIERIAYIVDKHQISCDFVRLPGYMFQGLNPSSAEFETKTLAEVFKAAKETGKLDVSLVDDARIAGFKSGQAIRFGAQATFHPTKYIKALAKVITEMGGKIYEKSRFMSYQESAQEVEATMANGKKVKAKHLVMATNVPLQKVIVTCACMNQIVLIHGVACRHR